MAQCPQFRMTVERLGPAPLPPPHQPFLQLPAPQGLSLQNGSSNRTHLRGLLWNSKQCFVYPRLRLPGRPLLPWGCSCSPTLPPPPVAPAERVPLPWLEDALLALCPVGLCPSLRPQPSCYLLSHRWSKATFSRRTFCWEACYPCQPPSRHSGSHGI